MRWDHQKKSHYFIVPDGRDVQEWMNHLEMQVIEFNGDRPKPAQFTTGLHQTGATINPIAELEPPDPQSAAIMARLPETHHQLLTRYQQMIGLKRYSLNTLRSYRSAFIVFLGWCGSRMPLDLSQQDILDYMTLRIAHGHISEAYQNLIINAIKFYFEKVENQPRTIYAIPRPKKHQILPKSLDKEEVKNMISKTVNIKHKCLIMLLYGCGLRLGEVIQLIPQDIDSKRMVIHIRRAKGKKDRDVPLPVSLLNTLREYFRTNRPLTWLFEGQNLGEPYSNRSVQMVVKQAAQRAGIERPVTAHMLRHSYATHLMESGIDLRYIQDSLGHASIKTTEIYTHVARPKKPHSPLDDL